MLQVGMPVSLRMLIQLRVVGALPVLNPCDHTQLPPRPLRMVPPKSPGPQESSCRSGSCLATKCLTLQLPPETYRSQSGKGAMTPEPSMTNLPQSAMRLAMRGADVTVPFHGWTNCRVIGGSLWAFGRGCLAFVGCACLSGSQGRECGRECHL